MVDTEARGQEHLYRLADELLPRVAKHPFGFPVDQQNSTYSVNHDHAARTGLNREPEPLLGLPVLRDVPRDRRCTDDHPGGRLDRRYCERNFDRHPVLMYPNRFNVLDLLTVT